MNREIRKRIREAKRYENIVKDALDYNYFNREARTRNFKALKKIQIEILKLYLEEKNEDESRKEV